MSKGFYPRLAAQNCLKNGKFYFPYLLTVICTAAAFYINTSLSSTPDMPSTQRYSYLSAYMTIGIFVLGLFIIIFLSYTNSFLMKRRVREIGLYNVLGMGKKSIGIVLCFESLYTWLVGVGAGVVLGILLQKLFTLLAQKLMRVDVVYDFYISVQGILLTAGFFGLVLALVLLKNLRRVHVQNPTELLQGGNVGEREPKTRWLLAVVGVLTLGAGYYIAVTTKDVMEALSMYFVAVFCVIIGTYCLFGAVSTALLKALRKNKKFFYKTGNFIGVSGMIHRMNRNAVGLGNICILSTMVLVMVSATLSLYVGTEDILNVRYPAQLNIELLSSEDEAFDTERAFESVVKCVEDGGYEIKSIYSYSLKRVYMLWDGESYIDASTDDTLTTQMYYLEFLTQEGYEELGGESVELKEGQALFAGGEAETDRLNLVFNKDDAQNSLSYELLQGDVEFRDGKSVYSGMTRYIVLPSQQDMVELAERFSQGGNSSGSFTWYCCIDIEGSVEDQIACAQLLDDVSNVGITSNEGFSWAMYSVTCREQNREEFYSTNGGFFFLGLFLGTIFIMAMVLIMYYKQISEGYEDRERFKIMQQVGLPKKDIRRSINMQVLIVFFAPLLVAGVHVFFDFSLVRQLLTLFGMFNWQLAAWCTLGCFAVFALLYAGVYALTAKTYYSIVSEKNID